MNTKYIFTNYKHRSVIFIKASTLKFKQQLPTYIVVREYLNVSFCYEQ